MNKKTPPVWVDRLLDAVLKERFADETIGDLHEWYELKQETQSKLQLTYYYFLSVVKALRIYKLKKIKDLLILVTEIMMVNNNIKLSIRSLINNRFFTVINLIGLSVSLVSFLFIYAYLRYELSFDDFHANKNKIYRVLNASEETPVRGRPTPTPLAPTFNSYFPDEVTFARFGQDPVFLQVGDSKFYEEAFFWGDPTIFTVFDLPFLYGNAATALTEPNTIVLTQEKSEAYFGPGVNPVGKILPVKVYDSNATLLMKVAGVMKKLPSNTELPFELIGSMVNALDLYKQFNNHWGFLWLHTYAYVPNDGDLDRIVNHIPVIREEVMASQVSDHHTFEFQPLDEVHLYSNDVLGSRTSGNINYVITFTIIGIFIILIATINYLNLMGARINKRRGEVGVRKVLGANKSQLFSQFLTESNLTIFISLLIAVILVALLFNQFTAFIDKPIPFAIFFNWETAMLLTGLVLICGAVSGIYPALVLTTLKLEVSVNNHKQARRRNRFQKALVTFQFAISVFLIISTFIIFQQVQYMTQSNLGFNKEQLVSIKVEDRVLQDKIKLIRDEMAGIVGVEAITISGESLPSEMNNTWDIRWEGLPKGESRPIHLVSVDPEFFDVLEIPIKKGTGFGEQHANDSASFIVINQTAADLLNSPDPVLQKVEIGGSKRT
ncbi:MAG: ABC transporter permease, partial [Bacteroidota bacterium]